jgi:hypothetical protein
MTFRAGALLALLVVPLVLAAGCSSPSGVTRMTVSGVEPASDGKLNLSAGAGLVVTPSPANHTLVIGLAPVAQTSVLQACSGACRNVTVSTGSVIADADLVGFANLTLVARSATEDNAINFLSPDGQTARFLRWSQAQGQFQFDHDLLVGGNVTATRFLGTRTPLVFGQGTAQQQFVTISTAALEGGEVAIFARGASRLVNGSANVTLPGAFQELEDAGIITVQLTLTSDGPALYVAEKARDHVIVRATGGAGSDATFDWFVQAPRKGSVGFVV